jgi:superfamily II DNA or RNA helicase
MAINLIEAFVKRNDKSSSLIIVPTQILKDQWIDQLEERGLLDNAHVEIINTAIKFS